MPFASNKNLPDSVKNVLPSAAQTIFRTVANKEIGQGSSEESAFRQAWTAVKAGWKKSSSGKWVKKSLVDKKITVNSDICKVDDELGLIFGYAMVCKIEGEDHYDVQGHHIPEDTMLRTLSKFMSSGNVVAKDMHTGEQVGTYVFAFPMTTEIAKSLNIEVKQTGALVAMKPSSDDILKMFKDGERSGFSVGGINPVFEDAPEES